MEYIKKFENNAEYEQYAASAEYIEPNVSLSVEENEVHFNKAPEPPQTPKWIATYQDSHTESAQCDDTGEIVRNEITKENLVSVEITDCVTTLAESAFIQCTSLTSIDIPNTVTTIGIAAFSQCNSLASIDIPNLVTTINNKTFYGCSGLTSIVIPSGVTKIGTYAFQECSSLTRITCLATTPPSLFLEAFYHTNEAPIFVPAESVDAYKAAEGWSSYASRIQPIQ